MTIVYYLIANLEGLFVVIYYTILHDKTCSGVQVLLEEVEKKKSKNSWNIYLFILDSVFLEICECYI